MDYDLQSDLSLYLRKLVTAVTVIFYARSFDHGMQRCKRRLNRGRGRLSSLTCLRSKIFVLWLFVVHFEQLVKIVRPLRLGRQALAVAALAERVIQTTVFACFQARCTGSRLSACLLSEVELEGFARGHVIVAALAIVTDE